MKRTSSALILGFLALAAPAALAQHSQTSSVVANPSNPAEIWALNRGNDSLSVIDTTSGTTISEIDVGVWPRTLAFSADGSTVFVANQRGNVEITKHFVTPFDGSEVRGSVSVIDVASKTVTGTLTDVGTEPYGLAVAPNGAYFAVTGHRSGTVKFYNSSAPYALLTTHQYDRTLNFIPAGKTAADVDSNSDFIPDLAEPRAFVIASGSDRMMVAHALTGYVSVLDLTLDGNGRPTATSMSSKIDLNTYPFHPIFNPVPVQNLLSQGTPRFLDDIALAPDGSRALVPHVLHNVNHDVNASIPGLAGDFANRVYPALTVVDTTNESYGSIGDLSNRLHHELSDTLTPAEYVAYGGKGVEANGGIYTLGGIGSPLINGSADFVISGSTPGDLFIVGWGNAKMSADLGPLGTLLVNPAHLLAPVVPSFSVNIPNKPALAGKSFFFQVAVLDSGAVVQGLTNGIEMVIGLEGFGPSKMGYRAGQPGKVLYNAAGDRAVMLNRGSEDVFLYRAQGSELTLMSVFPPRKDFVERAALDTATPMGDLPLGMALVEDATTVNDDAVLYVINETTHSLSSLRVDFEAGTIQEEAAQLDTLLGGDQMTVSERIGQELFEDASRAQTAGNFNNSCASCHFEGLADGNVWQRPAGPRSTMPVYGGSLGTGLILWKGVRLHMGETGPMFGGENGGGGILTDAEQQGLIDYHNVIPVPLNPNLDPVTGDYTGNAAFGKDLFFGTNDTGLNPSLRHAGCTSCHPDNDTGDVRAYTTDFLDPVLTDTENIENVDPLCFSLQENILTNQNIRNVNSGVNIDVNGDMVVDVDRNADGISDIETYTPMNVDADDGFERDDPNSYPCPIDPFGDPFGPKKFFSRSKAEFVVPTKLGVFSTGPYFHDHSVASLRMLLDPSLQQTDPQYGDPSYPGLGKFANEFHDVRGDESIVPGASKVQLTLQTLANGSTIDADVQALLEYISSL